VEAFLVRKRVSGTAWPRRLDAPMTASRLAVNRRRADVTSGRWTEHGPSLPLLVKAEVDMPTSVQLRFRSGSAHVRWPPGAVAKTAVAASRILRTLSWCRSTSVVAPMARSDMAGRWS
jgi:hypothetical protein